MKYLILLTLVFSSSLWASQYPEHWWKYVDPAHAPSWEVLPQEAAPGQVVLSKRNELGILSNFAATSFTIDRKTYASVEGFWQMMKYPENAKDPRATYPGIKWKFTRAEVAAMTGSAAKSAGSAANSNMKKMDISWVSYRGEKINPFTRIKGAHYDLIYKAQWKKLCQNPDVYKVLMSTGDLELIPDHEMSAWAYPSWHYNKMWMKIRDVLRRYSKTQACKDV